MTLYRTQIESKTRLKGFKSLTYHLRVVNGPLFMRKQPVFQQQTNRLPLPPKILHFPGAEYA